MSTNQQVTFPDASTIKTSISTNKNDPDYAQKQAEKKIKFEENVRKASDEYYNNLLQSIYNAIDYMRSKNQYTCVYVNVPTVVI